MVIKWGVLGPGRIANKFVADFSEVKNAEVLAVASRSQKRADDFAAKYNIKKAYQGYQKLVDDSEVDIIYIATPHNFHYQNILFCLKNDKSVFCEKPLTVNQKQLDELLELAEEKDLFLLEGLWSYYLPSLKKAQKWIQEGKIGEVRLFEAELGFNFDYDYKERLFKADLAGGALLDVGIYPLAVANFLIDSPVKELNAQGYLKDGVDEHNTTLLKFASGALAKLSSSLRAELNNEAYIYGTEGKIYLPDFWSGREVILENDSKRLVFKDKRSSQGYNYEIEFVSQLLIDNNKELAKKELKRSCEVIKLMDKIRAEIDLSYPFE